MKTKEATCISCGKQITVSKFMSTAKAKCEDCKAPSEAKKPVSVASDGSGAVNRTSNGFESREVPFVASEGVKVHPGHGRIEKNPNKRLRRLECPYGCGQLELVALVANDRWGDIVTMQCPSCRLVIELMDACPMRPMMRLSEDGISLVEDLKRKFAGDHLVDDNK